MACWVAGICRKVLAADQRHLLFQVVDVSFLKSILFQRCVNVSKNLQKGSLSTPVEFDPVEPNKLHWPMLMKKLFQRCVNVSKNLQKGSLSTPVEFDPVEPNNHA